MLIFLPSCSQRLSDCYLPMQYLKCSVFSIWVNNGCSLHTQTLTPNVEGTQLFGTSPHLKSDLFTSLALLFSVSSLRKKETHLVESISPCGSSLYSKPYFSYCGFYEGTSTPSPLPPPSTPPAPSRNLPPQHSFCFQPQCDHSKADYAGCGGF